MIDDLMQPFPTRDSVKCLYRVNAQLSADETVGYDTNWILSRRPDAATLVSLKSEALSVMHALYNLDGEPDCWITVELIEPECFDLIEDEIESAPKRKKPTKKVKADKPEKRTESPAEPRAETETPAPKKTRKATDDDTESD